MKKQLEKYKELFSLMLDDLKTKGKRHKQIPNILTILRLFAPIVVIPAFITGNIPFALISVAVFSLTDAADGFIARTFHLTSELGKDLDTVADKLFSATLLISLMTINPLYIISLVLEIIIGSICSYKKVKNIDIRTCKIGKIKTVLLDIFVVMGIGSLLIDLSPLLINIMSIITGVLQISTMGEYIQVTQPIVEDLEIKGNKQILEEDKEETYTKTIKCPSKYYGKNKEHKLVKTKF